MPRADIVDFAKNPTSLGKTVPPFPFRLTDAGTLTGSTTLSGAGRPTRAATRS